MILMKTWDFLIFKLLRLDKKNQLQNKLFTRHKSFDNNIASVNSNLKHWFKYLATLITEQKIVLRQEKKLIKPDYTLPTTFRELLMI